MTAFDIWADKGIGLVEPSGPLDADAVPALRAAVSEAANLSRRSLVVMLEEKVSTAAPVAIAAILIEYRRLRDRGGSLAVVGTQGPVASLLQSTHLGREIPVFTTLEHALADLAATTPAAESGL